jgi:hypothetical protein
MAFQMLAKHSIFCKASMRRYSESKQGFNALPNPTADDGFFMVLSGKPVLQESV